MATYEERRMLDLAIREAMVNGVLAAVSERVQVYFVRLHDNHEAIIGLERLHVTAEMLLELIEKEFSGDADTEKELEELQWPSPQQAQSPRARATTDGSTENRQVDRDAKD
jgi:hypothetical protein